jgi:multidrug transporter EmrE-like cation transporter
MTYLIAFISVLLNAFAQIFLKELMKAYNTFPCAALFDLVKFFITNLWFYCGMGCYAVSVGLWLYVLGKLEVSLAYPLLSIGYVVTAVIGFFFLHENVNTIRCLGLALIILGIIVISRSN